MTSCNSNNKFFGNRVQASRGLFTNRIDSINKNNNITIGGCADEVVVQGDLVVTGDNCATCLKTNDPDVDVNVSGSNPPTAGQVLVALDAENAEWQAMSGSGMGDVSGPASSTNNEIVRFDGTTGKLIKSDSSAPTTIDDNGLISGPAIETSQNLVALGQNISKTVGTALNASTTVIGNDSGSNLSLSSFANTFIGGASGQNTTTGDQNVFIGRLSGFSVVDGSSNVLIGAESGETMTNQSGCVLIGNQAGENNTQSNRLMIDNTNTNTPLIDGDFAGDTLQVNGQTTLGQTGNTTNVHAINGSVDPSAGSVNQYLIVSVNGTQFKIPLHNLV